MIYQVLNEKVGSYSYFFNFFFILIVLVAFSTSRDCKTIKIFQHLTDFGAQQLGSCISLNNLKINLKEITKSSPFFYDILRSIKRTYINPNYKLDYLSTNLNQAEKNSIKQISKGLIKESNDESPFIKGISNQKFS